MSNLTSLSIRTLIYGAIIFSAILVSAVGVNYALAGSPAAADSATISADVTSTTNGLTRKVEARLKAGVDAGVLTQEQADARLEGWKKDQAEGLKAREDPGRWTAEDVKARIQAAVESGKITQEQADEKLAWLEANEDSSWKDVVPNPPWNVKGGEIMYHLGGRALRCGV